MKYISLILSLVIVTIILCSCMLEDVGLFPDSDPPIWENQKGILAAIPGDRQVTIVWGEAHDSENDVNFLVYKDEVFDPFKITPTILPASELPKVYYEPLLDHVYYYTFYGLTNGTKYWFGVRARDTSGLKNIEKNNVTSWVVPSTQYRDMEPPDWDGQAGITSLVPGVGQLTAVWGTASDAGSPPVSYLVYVDTDIDPWDQIPIFTLIAGEQYILDELNDGQEYWVGVRCQDSVVPPNADSNTIVLSATPLAE